ncbi:taste receptor type 2 member 60 [Ctenodactylus gundi]
MSEDHVKSEDPEIEMKFLIIIIILLILCLVAVMGNGFIIIALGMKWLRRRTLSPYDKLLVSLATSRFCLQWVVIGRTTYIILQPTIFMYNPMMQFLKFLWDFVNSVTLWLCTCLGFFYCVKIANFTHPIFFWLKYKLPGWVPRLLLSSVVLSALNSFLFFIGNFIVYQNYLRDNGQSWNITGNSSFGKLYFLCLKMTTFTIPSGVFLLFMVLLLTSLGRHMKKILLGSRFQDPSVQAHVKALLSLLSFLILFISCSLSLLFSFTGSSALQEFRYWVWQAVFHLSMAVHPFVLLSSNSKLRVTLEKGSSSACAAS